MEPSIVTNASDLDSISHQLRLLEQHGELSTSAASWIRSAAQLYERNQLRLVVARDGNEITGAAALVETPIRLVNRWLLAGSNHLYEPDGLVYRDDVALAVLIGKLVQVNAPMLLSRIPGDQTWIATLRDALKRRAYVVIRPALSCPVIHLHSGWQDPFSQLSSRRRSDLRRAYGRAEKIGKVETIIATPSIEEVDALIERAMVVEATSWKGRSGTAMLTRRTEGDFFRVFAREASLDGSLRVSMLRIDGKDAAMQIAVVFRSSWWIYKIGYDEQFSRCSPGLLLISETIRHAAENQLERFEFMGTSQDWISMWTNDKRALVNIRTYPYGLRGFAAVVVDTVGASVTRAQSIFRKTLSKLPIAPRPIQTSQS